MRTLLIDRMEGIYAICEDADQRYFAIKQTELPQEAKEGDVIEISGEEMCIRDRFRELYRG